MATAFTVRVDYDDTVSPQFRVECNQEIACVLVYYLQPGVDPRLNKWRRYLPHDVYRSSRDRYRVNIWESWRCQDPLLAPSVCVVRADGTEHQVPPAAFLDAMRWTVKNRLTRELQRSTRLVLDVVGVVADYHIACSFARGFVGRSA